jgi:hypothetical protein
MAHIGVTNGLMYLFAIAVGVGIVIAIGWFIGRSSRRK